MHAPPRGDAPVTVEPVRVTWAAAAYGPVYQRIAGARVSVQRRGGVARSRKPGKVGHAAQVEQDARAPAGEQQRFAIGRQGGALPAGRDLLLPKVRQREQARARRQQIAVAELQGGVAADPALVPAIRGVIHGHTVRGQQVHRRRSHAPAVEGLQDDRCVAGREPGVEDGQLGQLDLRLRHHPAQARPLPGRVGYRAELLHAQPGLPAMSPHGAQGQIQAIQRGAGHQAQDDSLGQFGQAYQARDAGGQGHRCGNNRSRASSPVWRTRGRALRTAMPMAFCVPITTTSRRARVMAV